jgi:hypothetical protein
MDHINHDRVCELLEYCPDNGEFTWKVDRKRLAKAGSRAGSTNGSGYRQISIDGKLYLAHRLAWFYCFQEWPEKVIDHINGVKDDNRLDNLQDVSQNRNIQKANSKVGASGYRNVRKIYNRYQASIKVSGKTIHIGMYGSAEEAYASVQKYKEDNNL